MLSKIFDIWLSPNRTRVVYDVAATSFVSIFSYFFLTQFRVVQSSDTLALFLLPVLSVATNRALGIFTRFSLSSGEVKAGILAVSLTLDCVFLHFLNVPLAALILAFTIAFVALSLPRVFLNIDTKLRTNFVSNTLRKKGPVLVVGGAGYIGTHVVEELLNSNLKVRVLDKILYSKNTLEKFFSHPHFEFVEGDATDIAKLTFAMSGASSVVHLAGLVGDPACAVDESYTRHTNVITTRMVKEVAISFDVERFIFASSCSVYGASDMEVNETSKLNPVSLYAKTKIDSEKELLASAGENLHITILRFATVFGHSARPRFDLVANLFTAQALRDGKITVMGPHQWRPFIHCRDLAKAIVMTLKAPPHKVRGQIFNVGDRKLNMTIGELGKRVTACCEKVRAVQVIVQDNVTDKRNYMVSFDKIAKILGFHASVSVEAGVQEIIEEFQKGTYGDYKDPKYSNVEITKSAAADFHDPLQTTKLYRPVTDIPAEST